MSTVTGHSGKGLRVNYDFTKGGDYVVVDLWFATPLPTANMIGFWVKSPADISIRLVVGDVNSQSLAFDLVRPLSSLDPESWYQQIVPLNSPSVWWGGDNDGKMEFPLRVLSIVAMKQANTSPIGSIEIDDIAAITSTDLHINPAGMTLIPCSSGASDILPRLGICIATSTALTEPEKAISLAQSAGFSWVRHRICSGTK